ncbi:MAG: EamA family transporter [Verrucomicrobiales bacterium]
MPYYLSLPLAAAVIYSLGSIVIKRALKEGVSMDQSFHLTNLVVGLVFLPLLFFEKTAVNWSEVWRPLVMGSMFFTGNWLTFVAIKRGDVSLVTPIMGTKVVFVAIGLVILTERSPSSALWLAAIMTPVGIIVMSVADFRHGHHFLFTILVTLASAAVFGLCDVLVNWWAEDFGTMTFLTVGSIFVSVLSFIMWLLQGRPSMKLEKSQSNWVWGGAGLIGLQAIAIGVALGFFDDATGVNVVYASRGLWVILLVVVFGSKLGNSEHREQGGAFLWRVTGTVILTAAIVIAVIDRANATTST